MHFYLYNSYCEITFMEKKIMLKSFIEIPYTNGVLTTDGVTLKINDTITDKEFIDMSDYWSINDKSVEKIKVIAAAIFNVKLPKELISKIIVIKDKEEPNNIFKTYYKFPKDGIPVVGMDGYRYIPYHTSFAINENGEVYSFINKKCIESGDFFKSEYKCIRGVIDYLGGYTREGYFRRCNVVTSMHYHRLLAYAFCEYDRDPLCLVVNHIDGNKTNNDISNLEWVTYTDNLLHAFKSGLRNDNINVVCKDYITGEIHRYFSIGECGRQLGVDDESVRFKLDKELTLLKGRYVIQKDNDQIKEWPEATSLLKLRTPQLIEYTNVLTGEKGEVLGIFRFAEITGILASTVNYTLTKQLNTGKMARPIDGWSFKYKLDDRIKFREFNDLERIFYQKRRDLGIQNTIGTGYIVYCNGKLFDVYTGYDELIGVFFELTPDILRARVLSGKPFIFKDKEYYFKYLYKNRNGLELV